MKNEILFDYPNYLQNIFDKLYINGIKAIIVGGYVRDKLLNLSSKDIDIELYGVSSFKQLEEILQEFGNLNNVGKSFGVCKLSLNDLELDFTLPRTDNKISAGHSGFEVSIKNNLDFKTASSRRDFTINSIGYDTIDKKILDPFNGQIDIKNKILKAVNIKTFSEDPLRLLRAVRFSSNLNFEINEELFLLCKKMSSEDILSELSQERIYEEFKKILLKSDKPSHAFLLLKEMSYLKVFSPLENLSNERFKELLMALDLITKYITNNNKSGFYLVLSVLCYKFNKQEIKEFILNLTNEKKLLQKVLAILESEFKIHYTDYELYQLAIKVNIEEYLQFCMCVSISTEKEVFNKIKKRAFFLGVLHEKAKPFLEGKDILERGIKPSIEYSKILSLAYEAQMRLEINSKEDAKRWLKNYL